MFVIRTGGFSKLALTSSQVIGRDILYFISAHVAALRDTFILALFKQRSDNTNDHSIGYSNGRLLSHPNATLVLQARQARAGGENLNYATLVPQARQARPSGEILNYSLSC